MQLRLPRRAKESGKTKPKTYWLVMIIIIIPSRTSIVLILSPTAHTHIPPEAIVYPALIWSNVKSRKKQNKYFEFDSFWSESNGHHIGLWSSARRLLAGCAVAVQFFFSFGIYLNRWTSLVVIIFSSLKRWNECIEAAKAKLFV
jgi:hypothetical protein